MKKLILATVSVLVTHLLFGQTGFGLKAGLNFSRTKGFLRENNYLIAEHMGGFVNIPFNKRLFLRPELLYSVKGFKFPALGLYDKGSLSFSYLTVPILMGYKPAERVAVLLGPEVGYLINAKYRFPDSTTSHPEYFNKVDLAIAIGAAYSINKRLSAEFRYSHGFEDLADVIYTDQFGNQTGKEKIGAHRVLQLSINYLFKNK